MTSEGRTPVVSIGLPVYDGERYLEAGARSILAQGFEDFELIVVDNASTDATPEIARALAAEDPRVSYHRNETNVGAPANFNRAFDLARGRYFKWAAHDDWLAPDFLERTVAVLDADPGCVLSHSRVDVIDEGGAVVRKDTVVMPHLEDPDPVERFRDLVLVKHPCYLAFGLIRSEALQRTPRIGAYLSSDRCLLAELGLLGTLHVIEEPLYRNRDHAERSVRIPTHERARRWFLQGEGARFVFPAWRLLGEYRAAVDRAAATPDVRRRARRVLWTWMAHNWHLLRGDLRVAAVDLARSPARA